MHVNIPIRRDMHMGVTDYIMLLQLVWQFFTIRQTAKLKSSPNSPAIRYITVTI